MVRREGLLQSEETLIMSLWLLETCKNFGMSLQGLCLTLSTLLISIIPKYKFLRYDEMARYGDILSFNYVFNTASLPEVGQVHWVIFRIF